MCSASGQPSEIFRLAWSSLQVLLSPPGDLVLGISKGLGTEIKIISLPAHFSISSEPYIWGPRHMCPHPRYWILGSPYKSLTCCISSPSFFFLSSFPPFLLPPFEKGCQALLEHEDENESNLSTEATLPGIFKWDKWCQSQQRFPDILECQEPCRAVTQKNDFPAATLPSCHPATPPYLLMNVYFCRRWKDKPIYTAWGQNRLRNRYSLRRSWQALTQCSRWGIEIVAVSSSTKWMWLCIYCKCPQQPAKLPRVHSLSKLDYCIQAVIFHF